MDPQEGIINRELLKEKLERMNDYASAYDSDTLSQRDIASFLFLHNSMAPAGSQAEFVQKRVKSMMMVDTESALAIKEDFPELYEELYGKRGVRTKLEEQAKISGMEKVKHDFLGTKKLSAKWTLWGLERKENKIREKRAEKLLAKRAEAQQAIQAQREKLENKLAPLRDTLNLYKERLDNLQKRLETAPYYEREGILYDIERYTGWYKKIDVMIRTKDAMTFEDESLPQKEQKKQLAGENPISAIERMHKGSDYYMRIREVQDQYLMTKKIVRWSLPTEKDAAKPQTVNLRENEVFRDMARFAGKFQKGDEADPAEMDELTEEVYIVMHGHEMKPKRFAPPPGHPDRMEPVKAEKKKQKKALDTVVEKLEEKRADMEDFQKTHPALFQTNLDYEYVLNNYDALYEAYKMMQVTSYVGGYCIKSEAYQNLPAAQQKEILETRVYLLSLRETFEEIIKWAKDTAGVYQSGNGEPKGIDPENSFPGKLAYWRGYYHLD